MPAWAAMVAQCVVCAGAHLFVLLLLPGHTWQWLNMRHSGRDTLCGRWRGRAVHTAPVAGPGTCLGCPGRSSEPLAAVCDAAHDFATSAALCAVMVDTDQCAWEFFCMANADGRPQLPGSLTKVPRGVFWCGGWSYLGLCRCWGLL